MRILSPAGIAALALAAALAGSTWASAQQPDAEPSQADSTAQVPHAGKVFGYMDASSGEFSPLKQVTPDAATPAVTGTYEVTATITLKTPVPKGYGVYCFTEIASTAGIDSETGGLIFSETALSTAKVTGSTASCTVNTPYAWPIPKSDLTDGTNVLGIYEVAILPDTVQDRGLDSLTFDTRASIGFFERHAAIPATGTTTKVALAITL